MKKLLKNIIKYLWGKITFKEMCYTCDYIIDRKGFCIDKGEVIYEKQMLDVTVNVLLLNKRIKKI